MDRRASDDPLAHLQMLDAKTDRRRIRRPLSPQEFERLLRSAETGPVIEGLSGRDRAMLYIVASYTGYRRNEIGSVTKRSFDFTAPTPTLSVKPHASKRRKEDRIPLRRDVALCIQHWIADCRGDYSPDESLFAVTGKATSEMVKRDLKRAGIPAVDAQGRVVDFHALRGTFTTNLARAGVHPKLAQELARHSDINLTMGIYTTLEEDHLAEAVDPRRRRSPRNFCTALAEMWVMNGNSQLATIFRMRLMVVFT
jgi:integrase/recombinase XerC